MAEALLGVVSGGISVVTVAAQISSTIIKLKSLYDELREAPEDIGLLIEEVESLGLLLADIREDQNHNFMPSETFDTGSASRCLEHCIRGANHLKTLVADLGVEIAASDGLKKKWVCARVVLSKNKIEKYKLRLERAVRLLSLSYHCYTSALLKRQPDIIVARLAPYFGATQSSCFPSNIAVPASLQELENKFKHLQGECEQLMTVISWKYSCKLTRQQRRKFAKLYRIPIWLLRWSWDIEITRAHSGWLINLRTYNRLSEDNPAYKAVLDGNVQELRDLFGCGRATPLDVLAYSFASGDVTLLQIAMSRGHLSICRLLLENRAEPDESRAGRPILRLLNDGFLKDHNHNDPAEIARMLLDVYEVELEVAELERFRGSGEAFASLLPLLDIPYYETSLETRFKIILRQISEAPLNGPDLFRAALHPNCIPDVAIHYKSSQGTTLLHLVAYAMKSCLAIDNINHWSSRNLRNDLSEWRIILRELITRGAELHPTNQGDCRFTPGTPLRELLNANNLWLLPTLVPESLRNERYPKIAQNLLQIWLEDLEASGVSLLEYGHTEVPMFCCTWGDDEDFGYYNVTLVCGASVSDWRVVRSKRFWTLESPEHFTGEFWSLIESPPLSVPGMWID